MCDPRQGGFWPMCARVHIRRDSPATSRATWRLPSNSAPICQTLKPGGSCATAQKSLSCLVTQAPAYSSPCSGCQPGIQPTKAWILSLSSPAAA